MIRSTILGSALALVLAGTAWAGPQYVDETGYALSGYDPVAFFDLEQAPLGERQPPAVPGRSAITAEWNGATWAFATAENRERFLADPEAYAPAFDGHCAFGVAKGGKVPANPNLWRIVDGQLYVNINPAVAGMWTADVEGNLEAASTNWPGLEPEPASADSWLRLDANADTYQTVAPIGG
jgi:YHS domain-containing protein